MQCENKSNCVEKQSVFGCINRMPSQGGVVGHTHKQLSPEELAFASLMKPNLIISLTTVTFVLCVRMRRAHIPHKQDNESMSSGYVGHACVCTCGEKAGDGSTKHRMKSELEAARAVR